MKNIFTQPRVKPSHRSFALWNKKIVLALRLGHGFYPALCLLAGTGMLAQKAAPAVDQYVSAELLAGPTAVTQNEQKLNTLKVGTLGTMSVMQDVVTGQIRQATGNIKLPPAATSEASAKQVIQSNIQALGAPKAQTDLKLISNTSSLTGSHMTYQQMYNGYPVFGGTVAINTPTGSKGPGTIRNDLKIINKSAEASGTLSSAQAVTAALGAVHFKQGPKAPPTAELGILAVDGAPVQVWRVRYTSQEPGATWEVMVRSSDSTVLSVRNVSTYKINPGAPSPQSQSQASQPDAGATTTKSNIDPPRGLVFFPNPVQSTGIADFPDHLEGAAPGSSFQQIQNARVAVAVGQLVAGGHLDGNWASTILSTSFTRAMQPDQIFEFDRSDQRFDETMAYYWVTQSTSYAQSLGFKNVNNRQLKIDVNGTTDDNSWYSDGTLTFGTGGIRDAEDAEVIFHETGHSIQDSQVPGILDNGGHDLRSMSEGFSDYWAASFFADIGPKGSAWNTFFDKWDGSTAHPAVNGDPPYLRKLDSAKHYPEDIDQEVHDDGEIWSACLWKIRGILGRTLTDKLLLESNYSLTPSVTFPEAANIILITFPKLVPATQQSQNQLKLVKQVFIDRGILPSQ